MKIRSDINVIADLVEPNSKVLDIGCGEGEMEGDICLDG